MLLKLLAAAGLMLQQTKPKKPEPQKKTKAELRREKDRREYALWVRAEEYEE